MHSHITWAVAAMDSCFALIATRQHGVTVGSMIGENPRVSKTVYCRSECKHSFKRHSTQHMWEPLAGNRTAVLPRLARGRRIRSYPDLCASKFKRTNLKQGAHIHQPTPRPGQYLTHSIVFFHRIRNYNDIAIKVRVRFPFTLLFFQVFFQPLRLFILLRRSCSLTCNIFPRFTLTPTIGAMGMMGYMRA